jgi:hypothetical protein
VNRETGISSTGVSAEGLTAPVLKKETNPTRMCGVCGVTAGLKLCGGCGKVAFCSRDHQVRAEGTSLCLHLGPVALCLGIRFLFPSRLHFGRSTNTHAG